MSLRLITPAASYPVLLAEAKSQCRVDGADQDGLLNTYIAAATSHVELYTGRAIIAQTWELVLDAFSDAILIPKGPVQSITSVKYYDTSDVLQTLATDQYVLDEVSDPAWIVRPTAVTYPAVATGVNNVIIRFVAGYSAVPDPIKAAMLMLIAQWYDERTSLSSVRQSATADGTVPTLPNTVDALLANYRSF